MSLREVEWCLGAIYKRRRSDLATNAALHGHKIPTEIESDDTPIVVSNEMQSAMDKQIAETLARKQAERARRG